MSKGVNIDGVLVTWGDRLFYPGNRVVKGATPPKLTGSALRQRANFIRNRIEAIVRRAPQVMVKVTGGGRSMRAIAAHFRYISKNGRLDIVDDRGETMNGPRAVRDLAEDWRYSGSLIPDVASSEGRREAFNVMLSMPRGTDPLAVHRAALEFARVELVGHKYVMVLHDHQANPHVHLCVRAEGRDWRRLNPRKTDLRRWRETFAEKLRGHGIEAEATRQATFRRDQNHTTLWRLKARQEGRLMTTRPGAKANAAARAPRAQSVEAWMYVGRTLAVSGDANDRKLAVAVATLVREMQATTPDRGAPNVAPMSQPAPIDIGTHR